MATFHGIQVYEILDNGNILNAIYTNSGILTDAIYDIDNEIARKKVHDNKGVEGTYDCSYIESINNSVIHCELEISRNSSKRAFIFTWKEKNKPIWQGIGLMSGTTHISVSYVES